MEKKLITAAGLLGIALIPASASALLIAPVDASTPSQLNAVRGPENMINGSDFDEINLTVGTGTDNALWVSNFISTSSNDATSGNTIGQAVFAQPYVISFDLGANYDLNQALVWNWNASHGNLSAGVKAMEILVASTVGGSTTSLGTFNPTPGTGVAAFTGDTFNISASDVREVKFSITENYGFGSTNTVVSLAEVRFGVVPEPSSLALLGLGGLLIARRRRG